MRLHPLIRRVIHHPFFVGMALGAPVLAIYTALFDEYGLIYRLEHAGVVDFIIWAAISLVLGTYAFIFLFHIFAKLGIIRP